MKGDQKTRNKDDHNGFMVVARRDGWSQLRVITWARVVEYSWWVIRVITLIELGAETRTVTPRGTGDIEQFTPPPLQFPRFVIFVKIAFSEIWSLLAISTFCNFNRRAERAGEKMFCNFNVFAISTFPKSLECSNFHAVAISTFSDLQGVCNFYGLQFPHARGARKRKIAHLVCLYKAETTSRPPQARKN